MHPQGPSSALFFETINAYQRTEALRTGIELDLFTHIAAGQRTAGQIATACQASPRGIRILADYLSVLGFLQTTDDASALGPGAAISRSRKWPAYLGGALGFLLADDLRGAFQHLTAAVRRGGAAISQEGTVSHDNPIWVAYAR